MKKKASRQMIGNKANELRKLFSNQNHNAQPKTKIGVKHEQSYVDLASLSNSFLSFIEKSSFTSSSSQSSSHC